MQYRRAGRSGIDLPVLSLGFWYNFGASADPAVARSLVVRAFDSGITCFDLANEYGPPPGAAEVTLGKILKSDLWAHRDELIITSKAGFRMWPGPYGDGGSRKYMLASLDQSLRRLGIDYVDVYYHHRPDPDTPLEETMEALDQAVRSGKALYVGLSNYGPDRTRKALKILRRLGTPCILGQVLYNMLNRRPERKLLGLLAEEGLGCTVYSPLAEGILTSKYLEEVPNDSRALDPEGYLTVEEVLEQREVVRQLNSIALERGQSLAQLALLWVLRRREVASAIIGVRSIGQLDADIAALSGPPLSEDEVQAIDAILVDRPSKES